VELRNLCSSPNISQWEWACWAIYYAWIRWQMHTEFLKENLKGRDHFGDLVLTVWIAWNLNRLGWSSLDPYGLEQVPVWTLYEPSGSIKCERFHYHLRYQPYAPQIYSVKVGVRMMDQGRIWYGMF
jgi:hypothetical protein